MFKNILSHLFGNSEKKEEVNQIEQALLEPNDPEKVEEITMPYVSDSVKELKVAKWMVKPGDKVKTGDFLCEIETDKVSMELENFVAARILWCCPVNVFMKPGEVICKLEKV